MKIVITGGAGFIGSNASRYFLDSGHSVFVIDNLSRMGSKKNLDWLNTFPQKPIFIFGDIRRETDLDKCRKYIESADAILHLAGQVAVTRSVANPREDFESNTAGTLNVLECMRLTQSNAKLIYASTNKVYGDLSDVKITEKESRYTYRDNPFGISEYQKLDFHSPYGCSKGAADQYVHDYSRIYDQDTVVFRQSCIYGPRQFGIEDQGWVAWFMIAILLGESLTIYGNGKQVRDILYIDDLIAAFDLVIKKRRESKGKIYNIGGGPLNSISVWAEFGQFLEKIFSRNIKIKYTNWRPGDQPVYISDIRKAKQELGWEPKITVESGLTKLYQWISNHGKLFT